MAKQSKPAKETAPVRTFRDGSYVVHVKRSSSKPSTRVSRALNDLGKSATRIKLSG